MKYEKAISILTEQANWVGQVNGDREQKFVEAAELATDALAFAQALHEVFRDNGMTQGEDPDLNELENLFDALNGELAAAVLFLCEPSFARVPDMLRVIGKRLEQEGADSVPPVVAKGYARLAKRVENTRQNMQNVTTQVIKAAEPT